MKKPVPLTWLAIPVAAVAGYLGSKAQNKQETYSPQNSNAPIPAVAGKVTAWEARLEKCSAADLPAMYEEIVKLADATETRMALQLLCARWAEVDAPGGVAFFSKERQPPLSGSELSMIFTEWVLRDFESASAAAGSLAPGQKQWIASQLLEEDPDRFWQWFQKFPPPMPWPMGKGWEAVLAAHFDEVAVLAAQGEEEDRERVRNMPGSSNATSIYKSLAASLTSRDLAGGVEWAKAAPDSVRMSALQGALEWIAKEQPEKLAEYLPLLEVRLENRKHWVQGVAKAAIDTLAARDPLSALTWVSENQTLLKGVGQESGVAMARALSTAIRDGSLTPEQAFNAVRAADKNAAWLKFSLYGGMWDGLTADQLAGAAAYVKNVDSKESRPAALAAILQRWEWQDPAAARAFESQIRDPEIAAAFHQARLQEAIFRPGWDGEEKVATAISRIPAEQRAEVFAEVTRRYSSPADPARIADSIAEVPASPARDRALSMIAEGWGTADPLGVLEWTGRQTDPAVRAQAAGAAMESWIKADAWGASVWLKQQPQGEMRDAGATRLATMLKKEEPSSAWEWAGDIQDPAKRLETQSAVLREWRESSPAEARAALEAASTSLSADTKQRLWNTLEGRVNVP